ncbi:MAG: hypothetical protein KDA79_15620 [Planctomycetaceae bacterium]|nr:hypothetical protein [Planctomycetaceae bacterium]
MRNSQSIVFGAGDTIVQPEVHLPEKLDKAEVASLSLRTIEELSDVQLIELIRAARLPMLTEERMAHVEFMPRELLKQLACLARRCCRNQGY